MSVLPLGGPPLRAVQREPQAGRGHLVLRVPRAPRREGRAAPGGHAAGRPAPVRGDVVQAVPAARHLRQAAAPSDDQAQGGAAAALTAAESEAQTILDACEHLRDRLLFATLLDTGYGPKTGPGGTGPEVSPGRPAR